MISQEMWDLIWSYSPLLDDDECRRNDGDNWEDEYYRMEQDYNSHDFSQDC